MKKKFRAGKVKNIKVNKEIYQKFENPKLDMNVAKLEGIRNKSFLFLLPMTGIDMRVCEPHFVNCFVDDKNKLANLRGCLYILCSYDKKLHKYFKDKVKNYLYNYYVGEKDNIKYFMYCVSIQGDDFEKIIKSEYSDTSRAYKNKVRSFVYHTDFYDNTIDKPEKNSYKYSAVVSAILNKEKWLKTQMEGKIGHTLSESDEYWGSFYESPEREIYDSKVEAYREE